MLAIITSILSLSLLSAAVPTQEGDWPRVLDGKGGTVTMYQPQVESFEGDVLEARAAVAVKLGGGEVAPIFGAVWLTARVETDRDERLVTVREVAVSQTRFADVSEADQARLASFLSREIPKWEITISLDRLVADLNLEDTTFSTEGLKHEAPVIVLAKEPTILVSLDGEPILQDVEGSEGLQAVLNSAFPIVRDGQGTFYLSGGGDLWYRAPAITGPWEVDPNVPKAVGSLELESLEPEDDTTATDGAQPPAIIVATVPTELIVCDGEPSWAPVEGMDLLYMDNTDSDVFLEITTQSYYVVLSGRWYRGHAVDEQWSWEHVSNDELPGAFADIPDESVNGSVLTYVAGTQQAREAVLDATIPQTAAVRRDETSLAVEYDGDPEFVVVEDLTSIHYAVNTPSAVFKVGSSYHCCEQGVWYVASSPTGPWAVATEIPAVLYDIPASNPHYNVVYVRVYDVTPEVVYVGYTSGYLGCYYYSGCVVYGTGWYYHPWYRHYYYPRRWTWGLRVTYNPWRGWGIGLTYSNGLFTFGVGRWGRYSRARFGPGGYRRCHRGRVGVGYRKTNVNIDRSTNININAGDRNRTGQGGRTGGRTGGGGRGDQGNLYNKPENRDRLAARPNQGDRRRPEGAAGGSNNVYLGSDGSVYRRSEKGAWEQRDGERWKSAENLDRSRSDAGGSRDREGPGTARTRPESGSGRETRPNASTGRDSGSRPSGGASSGGTSRTPPSTQPRTSNRSSNAARPELERSQQSRQRGNSRSQSYQRSRGGSRGRAGGGRRR
ncbi:MAG: carbohydrate-binding family V/XII [Planctomycetota bacterium]